MPTIYDNIERELLAGLREALQVSRRADVCGFSCLVVGYTGEAETGCRECRERQRFSCLVVGYTGEAYLQG